MNKIIAVDFDGCLVTNKYPDIGEPIEKSIAKFKKEQEDGAKVILCKELEMAKEWDGHTDKDVDRLLSLLKVKEDMRQTENLSPFERYQRRKSNTYN